MIEPRQTRLLLPLPPHPRLLFTKSVARHMPPDEAVRYRSEELRRWLKNAANLATAQKVPRVTTGRHATLVIEVHPEKENRFDFGDRREPVLMLLEQLTILERSQVLSCESKWVDVGAPLTVTITERVFA